MSTVCGCKMPRGWTYLPVDDAAGVLPEKLRMLCLLGNMQHLVASSECLSLGGRHVATVTPTECLFLDPNWIRKYFRSFLDHCKSM